MDTIKEKWIIIIRIVLDPLNKYFVFPGTNFMGYKGISHILIKFSQFVLHITVQRVSFSPVKSLTVLNQV